MRSATDIRGTAFRRGRGNNRAARARALLSISLLALVVAACAPRPADDEPESRSTASELDSLPPDSPMRWVRIYDPERAANGYTLTLHRGRRPTLIDMNGRSVHVWPGARVKSRVRLLPDGSLLGLALGREVVEYDWDGRPTWSFSTAPDLPHHDIIRLANGNTLIPVLPKGGPADELVEVTRDGEVVWRWSAIEHLAPFLVEREYNRDDQTHINSVEELTDNLLFRQGDDRFRPGNLLVSARNLDLVFVIDRETDDVVWTYSDGLDRQHEARMVPSGFPGEGNIMLLDNGYRNRYRYRKSRIVEIDPTDNSLTWDYLADDFYSPTSSVEQPLSNGNVLISSSRGGRVFEVSRDGEIVWQWSPPYDPVRPQRYTYDYTPQLAALARPNEIAVTPEPGYRHVDRWIYRFARRNGIRKVELAGTVRPVLDDNGACRDVFLPRGAQLDVTYGIDRDRVTQAAKSAYAARFSMLLAIRGGGEATELFGDSIDVKDANRWRQKTLSLDEFALEWVELCVATEALGPPRSEATEPFAFWSNPRITLGGQKYPTAGEEEIEDDDLTEEEIEARREHLRALGYVD